MKKMMKKMKKKNKKPTRKLNLSQIFDELLFMLGLKRRFKKMNVTVEVSNAGKLEKLVSYLQQGGWNPVLKGKGNGEVAIKTNEDLKVEEEAEEEQEEITDNSQD